MLEETYNKVVQYTRLTTAEEIGGLLKRLPDAVAHGLADELAIAGDVHRYDAHAQRTYYFVKKGAAVDVWRWSEVHRPHEAGELIFLVVSATAPLDEKLANECYERATGRSVDNPQAACTQPKPAQ